MQDRHAAERLRALGFRRSVSIRSGRSLQSRRLVSRSNRSNAALVAMLALGTAACGKSKKSSSSSGTTMTTAASAAAQVTKGDKSSFYLAATPQKGDGKTVKVDTATFTGTKGWVAIHSDAGGAPGPVTRRLIEAFHKHVRGGQL